MHVSDGCVCRRRGGSPTTSPLVNSIAPSINSTDATAEIPSLLETSWKKAPTSAIPIRPIAVHPSVQSTSAKALARTLDLTTAQRMSGIEEHTAQTVTRTVGMMQVRATTPQPSASTVGGQRRGRVVAVNKSVATSAASGVPLAGKTVTGKLIPVPSRYIVLRPVCSAATRTATSFGSDTFRAPNVPQTLPGVNKPTAENGQKQVGVPTAVHTTVRQLLVPRVIPRAGLSVPASFQARTVTLFQPQRPILALDNKSMQVA